VRPSPRAAFLRDVLGAQALPLRLRDGWRIDEVAPEPERFLVHASGHGARFRLIVSPARSGLALNLDPGTAQGPKPALRQGLERVAAAVRAGQHRATPALWTRPVQAVFFLTDVCNLRCSYCVVPFGGNTLSEARVDRAFALLADEPAPGFTLLGGEPTLAWDRLVYVVEQARARHPGAPVGMVTNATQITAERAAWLAEMGLDVTVSLDGDLESHAGRRVGAVNTARERAVELYWQARRGLDHLQASGLGLRANMVVTPATAPDLRANTAHLYALGFDTISVSPAVGIVWPGSALEALADGLDAYAAEVLDQLASASDDRRQRTRTALQWELRRAWYFLGRGVFHPYARRFVFGADGRLFSDLYNHEIASELYLADMDAVHDLDAVDHHHRTTPQASYVAAGWSERVLADVRAISTVQLERLTQLDGELVARFPSTSGARELRGHPPLHG